MAKRNDELTYEQLEERKAKRQARANAKALLRGFVDASDRDDVKAAFKLLHGTGGRKRGANGSLTILKNLFLEKGELSELDIFTQFNYGRPTMTNKIRDLINVQDVNQRIWVTFEDYSGTYKLVGQGEYPPENWRGYTPTKGNVL